MNFFDKLFGRKTSGSASQSSPAPETPPLAQPQKATAPPPKPAAPSIDPASDPNMIRAYDSYGRELFITRQQWLDSVLQGNIEKAWNTPDQLASLIIGGLNDRFFLEMVKPAERLREIDLNPERGAVVLAIVYMESGRLDDAERTLKQFIQKHGERGVVLTNLAKVYDERGDAGRALETLWRALKLDPNQDNGFAWYVAIQREKGGDPGYEEGLHRIAAIRGSWRAQLWLARSALQRKDLAGAMALYEQSLANAGQPVPADALMQITGDLGNQGHVAEILQLAASRFDGAVHGLQVGNNLIKAHVDMGHLEEARRMVDQLHAQNRPDWKPTLNFWDTEIAKKRLDAAPSATVTPDASMELSMITLEGPVWLNEGSPAAHLFPSRASAAPLIVFLGSTAEVAHAPPDRIRPQISDGPGCLSRSMPLFLAEQVYLQTQARVRVLVPWIVKPRHGFVLSGQPWADAEAARHATATGQVPYVVVTHVKATTEPWQVAMRLIRTADAVCLAQWDGLFSPTMPTDSLRQLGSKLVIAMAEKLGIPALAEKSAYAPPRDQGFTDYLLRLEQLLAARCGTLDGVSPDFFFGEHEMIDGALRLCADHPMSATGRLLLVRLLFYLKKHKPQLVAEYGPKFRELQRQYPLEEPAREVVQQMANEVLAA